MRFFRKKRTIVDWIFILIGAKFYMDYILPTNPASKNPLWRSLFKSMKESYGVSNIKSRYTQCYAFITIHLLGGIISIFVDVNIILNSLVNFYPILVNIYLAIRLKRVIVDKAMINHNIQWNNYINKSKNYKNLKYNIGDKILVKKLDMTLHVNEHINSTNEPYIITDIKNGYYYSLTKYGDIECIHPIEVDEESTEKYERELKLKRILDFLI